MNRLLNWFKNIWLSYKKKRDFKKKLEELRKRDPFIYNH